MYLKKDIFTFTDDKIVIKPVNKKLYQHFY